MYSDARPHAPHSTGKPCKCAWPCEANHADFTRCFRIWCDCDENRSSCAFTNFVVCLLIPQLFGLPALQVILGLAQDTKDSRQRALQLKELKEKQAQDKANALKEAYLKKQLSKAMAKGGPAAKGKGKAAAGKQAPQ